MGNVMKCDYEKVRKALCFLCELDCALCVGGLFSPSFSPVLKRAHKVRGRPGSLREHLKGRSFTDL